MIIIIAKSWKKIFGLGHFLRVGRIKRNKIYFSFGLVQQRFYGDMVGLVRVEFLYPGIQVPNTCGYPLQNFGHIHFNEYNK